MQSLKSITAKNEAKLNNYINAMRLFKKYVNNHSLKKEDFEGVTFMCMEKVMVAKDIFPFLYKFTFVNKYIPLTKKHKNLIKRLYIAYSNRYSNLLPYSEDFKEIALSLDNKRTAYYCLFRMFEKTEEQEYKLIMDSVDLLDFDVVLLETIQRSIQYSVNVELFEKRYLFMAELA